MSTAHDGGTHHIEYVVMPDPTNPWLLARVRWPDVFEAISPAQPHWTADIGLFDLPYDPTSTRVSAARAAEIATGWGATLPIVDGPAGTTPSLIRRMPANWSSPSPTDLRTWSLDVVRTTTGATSTRRARWGRRRRTAAVRPAAGAPSIVLGSGSNDVIDLTDRREPALAKADEA